MMGGEVNCWSGQIKLLLQTVRWTLSLPNCENFLFIIITNVIFIIVYMIKFAYLHDHRQHLAFDLNVVILAALAALYLYGHLPTYLLST